MMRPNRERLGTADGRIFGSTITRTFPCSRSTRPAMVVATGSNTRPSVPTCSALDVGRERGRQHLRGQVRCGGPIDQEAVGGMALGANVGYRKRRGLGTKAGEGEVGAVSLEEVAELPAVDIGREAAEKLCRDPEPR